MVHIDRQVISIFAHCSQQNNAGAKKPLDSRIDIIKVSDRYVFEVLCGSQDPNHVDLHPGKIEMQQSNR